MRKINSTILALTMVWTQAESQQVPPDFFAKTLPSVSIEATLGAYGALHGADALLPEKTRQLVALGVAAQIPCEYCIHVHRRQALAAGASKEQIKEAVGVAAFVRYFSTTFYGNQYDLTSFKQQIDEMK